MKCNQLIEKSKKYKYKKCQRKFMKKHFGICNNEVLSAITLLETIKKIVDLK